MGIRVVHDAGAMAGLAGYAGGKNRAKARQQKYDQALWMQERRHQQDMERMGGGLKYRNALGGRRAGGGAADGGFWADPLADNEDLDPGIRRQRRAQREARARKGRMGKEVPSEWHPTYTSPAQIEQQQEQNQAALERQQEIAERDEGRAYAERQADIDFRRGQIDDIIPEVPKHLVGTEAGRDLAKLNQAEGKLRGGREFDPDRPETKEMIAWARQERERILRENPKPNETEEYNSNRRWRDPETGKAHLQPVPGYEPGTIKDGEWIPDAAHAAQQDAQQKQQEDTAAAAQKRQTEKIRRYEAMRKAHEDSLDPDKDEITKWDTPEKRWALAEQQIVDLERLQGMEGRGSGPAPGNQARQSGFLPVPGARPPDGRPSWATNAPQEKPQGGRAFPGLGGDDSSQPSQPMAPSRADELGTQLNDPSFGQQSMTREMEVRLGQSKSGGLPIVQQLIERARAGDTAAQRVCEKRGIKWQP